MTGIEHDDALEALAAERYALAAEIERLKLVHAGQARLALSAIFLADADGDEGTQAFYQEWVRNHDAALIESLAERAESEFARGSWALVRGSGDWLRDRAQQIREGEAGR